MLARLGDVLGWGCNLIALGFVALGLFGLFNAEPSNRVSAVVVMAGFAFLSFLVGRAFKYVLSGGQRDDF